MASDKIKRILTDQGIREARGELSYMFRRILQDIDMNPRRWEYFLQEYLERDAASPKNKREVSYEKGNLNAQFTHPKMTWRTFMEALFFLNPRKIKFSIELTWTNGDTTIHSMNIRTRYNEAETSVAEKEIQSHQRPRIRRLTPTTETKPTEKPTTASKSKKPSPEEAD